MSNGRRFFKTFITVFTAFVLTALPLVPLKTVSALGTNLIANPSMETPGSVTTSPLNWVSNAWGTNSASFQNLSSGRTGTKSVKTTISSYASGDAKWYFLPVTVKSGTSYTYSTYYQASVSSDIVLQITDAAGANTYQWLKTVPAATSWTMANAVSTLPATASKVSVFHVINKVGFLQLDDAFYGETGTVAAPSAPTVSITSPATNSAVAGIQNITATATSTDANATVAGVQFQINGVNTGIEDTTAPYTADWDTTKVANGSYSLMSVARSTNGLSTVSSPVTVTVNNTVSPPVDTDNLIVNPGLEIVDPANSGKPANWQSNAWGTNTASFSYNATGRTGRSVTTTLSAYSSGDAKWSFDTVAVTGSKSYLFRDYYKATVASRVIVAFSDASGAVTYLEVTGAPAATAWTQYQEIFYAPVNAVRATVYHLIDKAGTLSIDDAYMQVAPQTVSDVVVPNGSMELGTTNPTNWTSSKWGTNTASFQYVTTNGYTGTRSAKVTVSNYVDGDAKWYFNPITNITPGNQYRLTAYYKTNVTPHAAAMLQMADGTKKYYIMPNAIQPSNAATTWQKYSDTFQVPIGTVSVSAFMFINQNGWLQTDAYTLTDYKATGFKRPMLSMTFDDGHEDNVNTALPLLQQYGFKTTQCYATTFIEGNQKAINDVLKFKNAGHEICSHTVSHPFLSSLNATNLDYELRHSKEYLEKITGQPVPNFASPYGDYNQTVNSVITKYYQAHRTVDEGYNSKDNFDSYRLRVQNVLDTTSAAQVKIWIDQAKVDNTWLILVYHRIATNPGPYDSYTNVFSQHLTAIKASGISVQTYQSAYLEAKSQL